MMPRFLSGKPRFRVAVCLLAIGVAGTRTQAQQAASPREIKVPYALTWGDSAEKVREMLHAVKANETAATEKRPGVMVIEAEGLGVGDPLLHKSLFTFRDGSLVEIELQYMDSSWDGERAIDFFERTRRRIDERYGPGTLLANKVKERPSGDKIPGDLAYTLILYRWNQPTVALELNYYAVEGGEKAYRLVSLHYKTP